MAISDLDAGIGRHRDDKTTVNNQIVAATLMNLCDDPTRVSVGGEWRADYRARCERVPIVVTVNDLSRVYAPLTRSGRMDLWMWEPTRDEIAEMVHQLLKDDQRPGGYGGIEDARRFVDAFDAQPLDFFGAARSRCVDDDVRAFVDRVGVEYLGTRLLSSGDKIKSKSVVVGRGDVSLEALVRAGRAIEREQQNVLDVRLSREYLANWDDDGSSAAEVARRRADDRRRADGLAVAADAEEARRRHRVAEAEERARREAAEGALAAAAERALRCVLYTGSHATASAW